MSGSLSACLSFCQISLLCRFSLLFCLLNAADVAVDHEGIVRVVHNKAWLRPLRLLYVLFFHIVDLYLFPAPHAGVVCGETSCLLEGGVRKLIPVCLHDHMGAGCLFGVEPPVISRGKAEGQLIILEIVLPDIHVIAVA